jgi:hypothetical protein
LGPERESAEPRKARFFAEQKMRPNHDDSNYVSIIDCFCFLSCDFQINSKIIAPNLPAVYDVLAGKYRAKGDEA